MSPFFNQGAINGSRHSQSNEKQLDNRLYAMKTTDAYHVQNL